MSLLFYYNCPVQGDMEHLDCLYSVVPVNLQYVHVTININLSLKCITLVNQLVITMINYTLIYKH